MHYTRLHGLPAKNSLEGILTHTAPFEGGKLPCNLRTCCLRKERPSLRDKGLTMRRLLPEERHDLPDKDAMLCEANTPCLWIDTS